MTWLLHSLLLRTFGTFPSATCPACACNPLNLDKLCTDVELGKAATKGSRQAINDLTLRLRDSLNPLKADRLSVMFWTSQWGEKSIRPPKEGFVLYLYWSGFLLTAEASCSSVMSSTNIGLTAGSSGRASAEPIISRVIPYNRSRSAQTHSLIYPRLRNIRRMLKYLHFLI